MAKQTKKGSDVKEVKRDTSDTLKKAMLIALKEYHGNVSLSCSTTKISRQTHYRWLSEDQDYKAEAEEATEIAIDFVEDRLFDRIKQGDTTATIFYLKTIGKRRGYVERSEVTAADGKDLMPKPDLSKLTREELKVMSAIEKKIYAK